MKILLKDKVGSGSSVSIYFLVTMLNAIPVMEPEDFYICTVLLVHSEDDKWTPVEVSKLFFDKVKATKRLRMLKNAGHFPIESPGLHQLETELISFIVHLFLFVVSCIDERRGKLEYTIMATYRSPHCWDD